MYLFGVSYCDHEKTSLYVLQQLLYQYCILNCWIRAILYLN